MYFHFLFHIAYFRRDSARFPESLLTDRGRGHLFRGAGHQKRRGEQLKWFWYLGCTLEVFHVHSYQYQFIQPGWAGCFFVYLA